jgi:hypothetical protein
MLTHDSRRNKEQKQDDLLAFALFMLLLSAASSPGKRKEEKIDQHPRKCLQNVHSFHVFLLYKVYRKLLQKSGSAWDLSLFLLQNRNAQNKILNVF